MSSTVPDLSSRAMPLRGDVRLARIADGGGVLTSSDGSTLELNATALALFELCDGATTVGEIVLAVCDLFGLPQEQAEAEVAGALRRLRDAGVLT